MAEDILLNRRLAVLLEWVLSNQLGVPFEIPRADVDLGLTTEAGLSEVAVPAIQYASIDIAAAAADNEIVSRVPGKRIYVLSYAALAADAVDITWNSKAADDTLTPLSGDMELGAAGGGLVVAPPHPVMRTGQGEALVLTTGDAVAVAGHLTYITK